MLSVRHTFVVQFFCDRLFVRRRHRGCLLPSEPGTGSQRLSSGIRFGRRSRRIDFVFPLQFALGLVHIGIQDIVLRAAIDDGNFARAFHDHFLGDRPETFAAVTQPAFFNSILFHESSLSLCIGGLPLLRDIIHERRSPLIQFRAARFAGPYSGSSRQRGIGQRPERSVPPCR